MAGMGNLVHNERTKLRANLLNTAAGSCLSLGVLSPLAASFFNLTANRIPTHIVILGVAFWLGMAYFRHQRAQAVLGGLRE